MLAAVSEFTGGTDMLNKDQVCIVTGAGQGIGRAIAEVLAEEGATVVLAARNAERLEEAASAIRGSGGKAMALPVDITDRGRVKGLVARVVQDNGRIDVLVNNAGLMPMPGALVDTADEVWDALLSVNTTGTYNMTKAVLPAMQEKSFGRVINVSSRDLSFARLITGLHFPVIPADMRRRT